MTTRLIKLFVTLILVAIISAVFILNPEAATVNFGSGKFWTAPLALILVTVFCLGVVVTALISAIIGSRLSFQLWSTKRLLSAKREHESLIASIIEQLAVGRIQPAIKEIRRFLQEDPESITGRILLTRALTLSGQEDEALQLVDETRAQLDKNAELLKLAADIHQRRGNRTAEFDNLAVILTKFPDAAEIVRRVVDSAESIGQLETAKSYLTELINKLPYNDQEPFQQRLAALELRIAENSGTAETIRSLVEQVLKRHRDFTPAQAKLGELDLSEGKIDAAIKNFQKATTASGEVSYLEKVVELLLKQEQPTKAVSVVRATLDSSNETSRFQIGLFLCQLLTHLGLLSEAKNELKDLQEIAVTDLQRKQVKVAESLIVAKTLGADAANKILAEVGISELSLPGASIFRLGQPRSASPQKSGERAAPAPQLSTP